MMQLFVGGLSENTSRQTLEQLFSKFGSVNAVKLISHKNIAFISMDDADGIKAIKGINGYMLDGKKLRVNTANPPGERGQREQRAERTRDIQPQMQSSGQDEHFVNPYNFVPVKQVVHSDETLRRFHASHSHWQEQFRDKTHSGRIVCELETESEMFIGAGKKKDTAPAELEPYTLNGKPAIPPSSLKGMLSSIMEAASNSALRVLDRNTYTRRMELGEAYKKIGIIIEKDDGKGKTHLYIMPLRKEPKKEETADQESPFPAYNPSKIDKLFPVYIDGYDYNRNQDKDIKDKKDFSADCKEFYLDKRQLENKVKSNPSKFKKWTHFFLGYKIKASKSEAILTKDEYDKIEDESIKHFYERGLMKILGIGEYRKDQVPGNKRHEFFLFLPDTFDVGSVDTYKGTLLDIADDTCKEFKIIAEKRSSFNREKDNLEAWLPYTPKGRKRTVDAPKLKLFDIVYYKDNGSKVTCVSFSACWRFFCGNTYGNNDAYGYFRLIDQNGFLLPPSLINQNISNPEDLKLAAASSLMGFVEEEKHPNQPSAFALAGRLFFSPGILILSPGQDLAKIRNTEKPLKILDGPKPPCPEFYFNEKSDPTNFTTKKELKPDGCSLPNGRKFYWHHHKATDPDAPTDTDYISEHKTQISTIAPIDKRTKFLFTIDFFNLTDFELGMLLYAIKPTDAFRHLIGMGKPIGLGRVKIEILNLLFVDRKERYEKDGLFDDHFFHLQTDTKDDRLQAILNKWSGDAPRNLFERQRFCISAKEKKQALHDVAFYVETFRKAITSGSLYGPDSLKPLEKIGDPASTQGLDVRYPPDPNKPAGYDEAFKWWVRNADKVTGKKSVLPVIAITTGAKAPTLFANPRA